jgi:hypothetical protein
MNPRHTKRQLRFKVIVSSTETGLQVHYMLFIIFLCPYIRVIYTKFSSLVRYSLFH